MGSYRPTWAPDIVDLEIPSAARMYDYYLGGSHNFAADRRLAEEALKAWPETPYMCRANRAFLRRAVTFLAEQGVDQFLDLGSGIPTAGNVHEIAQAVLPEARTVYVDCDAVAYAHGRALLKDDPQATYVLADLRDPEAVLASPEVTGMLDLERPVAVLMLMTLHFVPDSDDPKSIVSAYREAVAPGSYFVFSHGTNEYRPADTGGITKVYTQASHGIVPRDRARIQELAAGWELLSPGLVDVILWRPDPAELDDDPLGADVTRYSTFAAVGRTA
ncbi:MAG TPA: SAM-dependent methyltransferase [Actinospica sp.]|jgi:SAM-dependent methyltransferase|nr:SAM-dependent methyltransferase [Actinospica sp.]